jgi:xylan 1,4-beta-xylosidase
MRSKLLFLFVLSLLAPIVRAQTFTNPILAGGYPDPSVCYVDGTFYMANSSFEYFPGLPIHKSTDLVNWELIGHGLNRRNQVNGAINLLDVQANGGIYAPSFRYHDGTFYLVTTNVYKDSETKKSEAISFILTAENPEGPWSNPHIIEGAPGIDPDIFFDDDGTVWYIGMHEPRDKAFDGEREIWIQELDVNNFSLKGERHYLWRGACGGVWAEGPHIYKKDNNYYLMIAEGGTSFNHAVMVAISDQIQGPYTANKRNPILSSRQLSYDNWINSTGHGDLIELADGRWYVVLLGIRGDLNRRSNMGRETHIAPVIWEREPYGTKYLWPVIAPKTGKIERLNPHIFSNVASQKSTSFIDDFDEKILNPQWTFVRAPMSQMYELNKSALRLYAHPNIISPRKSAHFMGIKQTESDFELTARMRFSPKNNNVNVGLVLFQKDNNYIEYTIAKQEEKYVLKLSMKLPNELIVREEQLKNYAGIIEFSVTSKENQYHYYYSIDNLEAVLFASTEAHHMLSKGFTGAHLGVYATSNGNATTDYVDIEWVNYQANKRYLNK